MSHPPAEGPHVCHVSTTFFRRVGSCRRTRMIHAATVAAGWRTTQIVGRDHDTRVLDLPGVALEVAPCLVKRIHPLDDLRALVWLTRELRRLRPALVHTHLPKAGAIGRWAAVRAGVPAIVHTVHGPTFPDALAPPVRWLLRAVERSAARRTNRFVFVGQELRDLFVAAGAAVAERSTVIPTAFADRDDLERPADADRRRLRAEMVGAREVDFLLLNVGRLVPAKGQEDSIALLARLRRRGLDVRLALAGVANLAVERRHEGRLHDLAARLGVAGRVHFLGHRDDVLAVMAAVDMVLTTSRWEGLPNVVVEASLAGAPLLGYAVTGVTEAADPEVDRIVPAGDLDALEAAAVSAHAARGDLAVRAAGRRAAAIAAYRERARRLPLETMALYGELLAPSPGSPPSPGSSPSVQGGR